MTWYMFYAIVIGINVSVIGLGVLRASRRSGLQDD
jgi:hypothetical protein